MLCFVGNIVFVDCIVIYLYVEDVWTIATEECTVYPKKYAHGFVVLCFVVVMQSFIMNSHEVFIHIHQGCFAGTGAIVRLPQCQWSKPDGYGKISQCITTTKHSKAKTVCIFLGIYCMTIIYCGKLSSHCSSFRDLWVPNLHSIYSYLTCTWSSSATRVHSLVWTKCHHFSVSAFSYSCQTYLSFTSVGYGILNNWNCEGRGCSFISVSDKPASNKGPLLLKCTNFNPSMDK